MISSSDYNNHHNYCDTSNKYKNDLEDDNVSVNTKWQYIPYAGMDSLPVAETPNAWSYPLCFLKRRWDSTFVNMSGDMLNANIKNPHKEMDINAEFEYLYRLQRVISKKDVSLAKYWSEGPPSKQLMPIADILIDTYNVSACNAARILYILNGALNDTLCVTWYYKFLWNIIRPCQYDREFRTIVCTPFHPSYPAGHSTCAGCMAEILSYYFPKEREKLFVIAESCSNSRYIAGVHYRLDCDEGLKLGVNIAKCILKYTSKQTDVDSKNVDVIYKEYKNANILPINLTQYIPFNRQNKCQLLLLDTSKIPNR